MELAKLLIWNLQSGRTTASRMARARSATNPTPENATMAASHCDIQTRLISARHATAGFAKIVGTLGMAYVRNALILIQTLK